MKNVDKEELHILFEGIRNENKASFDTLYEKYKNLVFGIAFTVCKSYDIADEVVQNVFLKIWKLSKEKLPTSYEASWLYTITKNQTIDILRKNQDYIELDSIYSIQNENDDINSIVDIDSYNRKISSLNEQEQQILSLKLLSNFTFKEIGELLNIPAATAQWKYYKSINSLKLALANLAMFILTFAVYIKSKLSNTNKSKIRQTDDLAESMKSNPSSDLPVIGSPPTSIDTYVSTDSDSVISQKTNNNTPILCISSVFLILTIVFAIIFKKSQQKLKSKTSKHCMKK